MYIPDNYDAFESYERENNRLKRYYDYIEDEEFDTEEDEGEDE